MRTDLPSGTVTFLFTDVEGSTRLLHALGAEAYAEVLAEHRRLIREACAAEGGVEVDTQGDAFFLAFLSAPGALAAASAFTEALASRQVQVRVGLHTGTPLLAEEGYVGDDVHLAARVASAAHGGQVVLSAATAELLPTSDTVSQGGLLVSLGSHRLKDVAEPVTLYQLGGGSFPPLKTIANTNLPTPASSFLGRQAELLATNAHLQQTRLLTITGPGGQGKTRFALELATRAREERFSDYPDGVFSCFLASLRDPSLVLPTIAQALAVREQPGESALDALASHFAGKRMLLLLDNLEHLLEVASELSALLERCSGLNLLVTSRELLRIQGETAYALPPLHEDEGIALFCERARTEPTPVIAELARRLEGLPLALELAAARLSILTPEQLLERLASRLDLLKGTRDADPRQQTLRATIEWSYDLLSPEEQQLFCRLSIFAGGCTLEAAEEVASADLDTLQSLVEKSLLRFTDSRFWMLETIREYAGERLAARPDVDAIVERLRRYIVSLAEARASDLQSEREGAVNEQLEREYPNVRAAMESAIRACRPDDVGRVLDAAFPFIVSRGHVTEARMWLDAALADREHLSGSGLVSILAGGGEIARFDGDADLAVELKEELLALAETSPQAARWRSATLADLCDVAIERGDYATARRLGEESLVAGGRERAELSLAELFLRTGDLELAAAHVRRALDGYAPGEFNHSCALEISGELERRVGNLERSRAFFSEGLKAFASLGAGGAAADCLDGLAQLESVEGGDLDRAGVLRGAADEFRRAWRWRRARADADLPEVPDLAFARGAAMSLDEAIAYALEERPDA